MAPTARIKSSHPPEAPETMEKSQDSGGSAFWCVVYGLGIIGMLGAYGVIQERIMSEPYGDGEMFGVSVFLVLSNRLVAIAYALFMVFQKKEACGNKAPLWKYLAVSLSNVAATWCQYEALKYVSFPVQMLGKSFKMMPVMLWGILISRKSYGLSDWAIAGAVTWGVTQFLLTGEISAKHKKSMGKSSSSWGLLLLLAFLVCDGFTSTFQEKLFKEHKTSKYNQMLYVNSGSAVVSAATLLVSGKAGTAISFCLRHPDFNMHSLALSATSVGGQFFIYSQVKEFGALVLAATMNLRQVLSILVSYVMYLHPISLMQFLGLVLVFGALFGKSYMGFREGKKPREEKVPKDTSGDLELSSKGAQPEKVGAVDDEEEEGMLRKESPETVHSRPEGTRGS